MLRLDATHARVNTEGGLKGCGGGSTDHTLGGLDGSSIPRMGERQSNSQVVIRV